MTSKLLAQWHLQGAIIFASVSQRDLNALG